MGKDRVYIIDAVLKKPIGKEIHESLQFHPLYFDNKSGCGSDIHTYVCSMCVKTINTYHHSLNMAFQDSYILQNYKPSLALLLN